MQRRFTLIVQGFRIYVFEIEKLSERDNMIANTLFIIRRKRAGEVEEEREEPVLSPALMEPPRSRKLFHSLRQFSWRVSSYSVIYRFAES